MRAESAAKLPTVTRLVTTTDWAVPPTAPTFTFTRVKTPARMAMIVITLPYMRRSMPFTSSTLSCSCDISPE